jgi:tripartite-type tricarboxylate transporter receptor subunit TctC
MKLKLRRRHFLNLIVGAAALPALPRISNAQNYPARPVRVVVGFPPGGSTDVIARLIAQWLGEQLGQRFIVENMPGAGTNIATEAIVQAEPDGYTLLLVTASNAINATMYERLSFDFLRDIAPIAGIIRLPNVMVVNPAVPATTVPEFIAYAKANPGKINMASGGIGSISQVTGELFKMMAGVNLFHVPYRGDAPALVDMVGGQMQVMFDLISASIEFVKDGRLRALAVTSANRSQALPHLPAMAEFLPGYESTSFEGLGAPKNTPTEIIAKLNEAINAALADPNFKARLSDLGGQTFAGSPAEFGKFLVDETDKWAKVIKFAGIKPG